MAQALIKDLGALLQAHLNCRELCQALHKQTDEFSAREALDPLIDELQESLASLASHLRLQGGVPGTYDLDVRGKAIIRDMLGTRSLPDQLRIVRACLADLVAWYAEYPPADQADPSTRDCLASLSAQSQRMLEQWDQQMREIKAAR